MATVTKLDLDNLARKRRVRSMHKWFAVFQRSANRVALPAAINSPQYAGGRP